MIRRIVLMLLFAVSLQAQNKTEVTPTQIITTFPGIIKSAVLDTVPIVIYQSDGSLVRVPFGFSKWVTSNDIDSVKLGTLPVNAQILDVSLFVHTRFNSIDSTTIQVGHPADRDAYIKSINCNSVGVKTNLNAKDGVRVGKNENIKRIVYAYQTDVGSNATTGKVLITIRWQVTDSIP